MLEIVIPGSETLRLDFLVANFDTTIGRGGMILPGAAAALRSVAESLAVHIVTADTSGRAKEGLAGVPCKLAVLPERGQDSAKLRYVEALGAARCVCIGNSRSDRPMLAQAALGIAVICREGTATETLLAAKVAVPDINAALELLLDPRLLVATLQS